MGRFINADSYIATGQGFIGFNMFAYCNNNPTTASDPSGCRSSLVSPHATLHGGGGSKFFSLPNDKYSKTTGMINGQKVFEHAEESMMFGTYRDNGCGIIALYNAMQLLEKPQALGKIEDQVFIRGGMLAGGLLGIRPGVIGDYFSANNIPSAKYSSFEALSQDVYEGAVVVFMVQNNIDNIFDGCHYMTAQYTEGQYIVYNISSTSSDSVSISSLDPVYRNSRWICGYIAGGQS